jgi:hypothetical protein
MAVLAVGARFPSLLLPTPEQVAQPLSALWEEGGALVVIGHGGCPTTRLALPYVDRIHRRGSRLPVVAILQEDAASARALAEDLSLVLPLLLDPAPYVVGEQLGLETVPTLFQLDAEGRVVRVVEGFDRSDLESVAAAAGVGPLFEPSDPAPARKPG